MSVDNLHESSEKRVNKPEPFLGTVAATDVSLLLCLSLRHSCPVFLN